MKKFAFLMLAAVLWSGHGAAQDEISIRLDAEVNPVSVERGGAGTLMVRIQIGEGYHISDASSGIFEVVPGPVEGIAFSDPSFPEAEEDTYGFVYRGDVEVPVAFRVEEHAGAGQRSIRVQVTVQPCSEDGGICYPPETREVETTVRIVGTDGAAGVAEGGIAGRLTRALERGSFLAFFIVFLGGILTSLTPCVYPMIPITIAVIGAQATGGKFKGFVLSLFYVLGIAVTFSTLGVIAAKTGGLFGSFAQHPIAVILIAAIFLLMGLSMLGAFVIQMPASMASKLRGKQRSGFVGAFITGMLAGLVVSPCISPLLVVILTWVAKTGSVILGIGLLFSFALGLGILFIVIGTFSGVLKNLPKSGGWMEAIERGFGLLLVALAIVFLKPLLSTAMLRWAWAALFILTGSAVGAFVPLTPESAGKDRIRKGLGILMVIVGASLVFFGFANQYGLGVGQPVASVSERSAAGVEISSDEEGFAQARREGKPVVLDFWAEWCPACHELDEKVWPQAAIREVLKDYVFVKLDLTKNDERSRMLQKEYGILGMPTVIVFTTEGKELSRFEGFKPAEDVLALLQEFRGTE